VCGVVEEVGLGCVVGVFVNSTGSSIGLLCSPTISSAGPSILRNTNLDSTASVLHSA
jgi:hypothetical protein